MIRKPTNLLLTKTLKSSLVELTAAESEIQLTFSQVKKNRTFDLLDQQDVFFSLCKSASIHYISKMRCLI
jgi:hypothetical protein